jgi:putative solute:sodium symporter small subunit
MTSETATETDERNQSDVAAHRNVDYLEREVNLLRPSTPFMRDHLRLIWTGFVLWALVVFGPVTLTAVAPGPMTAQMPVLGFPLHYFLIAFGAPTGSLVLAALYTRYRDRLDEKYGIDPATVESEASEGGDPAAADGGVEQ